MSTAARVWLGIGAFLMVAGTVYGLTSHELAGAPLLLVGAGAFGYLGLVTLGAVRRGARQGSAEEAADEGADEPHVEPTIWPFAFSIAAVLIGLGAVISRWIILVGVAVFAVSAAGWLSDVRRSRSHASH